MTRETINSTEKSITFNDDWSPKIVGELNNQKVRVDKFKGAFFMHYHLHEEEFFSVILENYSLNYMTKNGTFMKESIS